MGNSIEKSSTESESESKARSHTHENPLGIKRLSASIRRLSKSSNNDTPVKLSDVKGTNINRTLSDDGRKLFSDSMTPRDPNKEQQTEQTLATIGASILNHGINASNKSMIQDFAKRTSKSCADCFSDLEPRWCVLNFGVFVCDDCAGAHRSLPATLTGGVRSIHLDDWSDEMRESVLHLGGNDTINASLEYFVPSIVRKPKFGVAKGKDRREWVDRKYVKKEFAQDKHREASPKAALPMDPPVLTNNLRLESFSGGREPMVGVLDITVLEITNLPKKILGSRRLHAGYKLEFQLGRSKTESKSSLSGRKWLLTPFHLSWDGNSALDVTLSTGTGTLVSRRILSLRHLMDKGTTSEVIELRMPHADFHAEGEDASIVRLRLDFVDLRS